jgi:hypothetical protein
MTNIDAFVKEVQASARKHCHCSGPPSTATTNPPPTKQSAASTPSSNRAPAASVKNTISSGPPQGKPAHVPPAPPFDEAGYKKCMRNADIGEGVGTAASAGLALAGTATFGITTVIGGIGALVTKGVANRARQKCASKFGA